MCIFRDKKLIFFFHLTFAKLKWLYCYVTEVLVKGEFWQVDCYLRATDEGQPNFSHGRSFCHIKPYFQETAVGMLTSTNEPNFLNKEGNWAIQGIFPPAASGFWKFGILLAILYHILNSPLYAEHKSVGIILRKHHSGNKAVSPSHLPSNILNCCWSFLGVKGIKGVILLLVGHKFQYAKWDCT